VNASRGNDRRPTREELDAAYGASVPDVIGHGLRVLFCGINPSLYSGAVGHHFARPGNRFWAMLAGAGLTDRELAPFEERDLLRYGLGVTNLVNRATATAAELTVGELRDGARRVARKVRRYAPSVVAFLGMDAYRTAFERPRATVGLQPERLERAAIWLLPNPSGAQAAYQLEDLVAVCRRLRRATRSEK
jgi:double-stranded uracil-DNA glycosylase